jgi:hypothetical protein
MLICVADDDDVAPIEHPPRRLSDDVPLPRAATVCGRDGTDPDQCVDVAFALDDVDHHLRWCRNQLREPVGHAPHVAEAPLPARRIRPSHRKPFVGAPYHLVEEPSALVRVGVRCLDLAVPVGVLGRAPGLTAKATRAAEAMGVQAVRSALERACVLLAAAQRPTTECEPIASAPSAAPIAIGTAADRAAMPAIVPLLRSDAGAHAAPAA